MEKRIHREVDFFDSFVVCRNSVPKTAPAQGVELRPEVVGKSRSWTHVIFDVCLGRKFDVLTCIPKKRIFKELSVQNIDKFVQLKQLF